MKYRWFFIFSLTIALIPLLKTPVINGYVDYHRVLHNDYHYTYPGDFENRVYLKARWLLETKGQYDSIIFGSSRVIAGFSWGALGSGWAKHDVSGGLPKEGLNTLQVLLQNKAPLKEVILTVDDFNIYYQSRQNESDYRYRFYPKTWVERIDLLYFYLFEKVTGKVERALKGETPLQKYENITGDLSGKVTFDSYEEHEETIKKMDAWDKDMPFNYEADVEGAVKSIVDFVRLCEENDIKVTVLMTPRHYKILYSRDFYDMAQFRLQLAAQVNYWDFTNLKSGYWKDNHLWSETSHFGTELGDLILERVRGNTPESSFGMLVNSDNVDDFVKDQYQILAENYLKITSYDSNTYIHDSYLSPWQTVGLTDPKAKHIAEKDAAVMQLKIHANEEIKTSWFCHNQEITLYLNKGENTRFLPWDASCLAENKNLDIQSVLVAKVNSYYSIKNSNLR